MKTIFTLLYLNLTIALSAQITIKGTVTDKQGNALPGVNIYIENSYDGTSSDSTGHFNFHTDSDSIQYLIASFIGYQKWRSLINTTCSQTIAIALKESVNTLDAVTITAGTFAASDQKRAAVMEPLDIYTTASANGDVMAAIRTLPGTQAAPDDGRLMVRGGDAYESKTYIDGLIAAKPYYSKTPDVASRGRFSPSLFSGVLFNSGGYSAEFGQALSSVLELNTSDIAASDNKGASFMSIGTEANYTKTAQNSSIMLSGAYTNMALYHKLFKSNINWTKPVESFNLTTAYRYKPRSSGILKALVNAEFGRLAYTSPEAGNNMLNLTNKNSNIYTNFNYRDCISEHSCYKVGVSLNYDNNAININNNYINTNELELEGRFTFTHSFSDGFMLNAGFGNNIKRYHQEIGNLDETPFFKPSFSDQILSCYIETEIKFNKHMAIRPGIRTEYSTILNQFNIAPRFALAFKTGKNSQLSAAYGHFYQNPEADYLKFQNKLKYEEAIHYILSYQSGKVNSRLFRAELYYKTYQKLITWEGNNQYFPQNIQNNGKGYAGGLDIFWRDKKTLAHFEYWLCYSYIDTKRFYQNLPITATPGFVSDHTFSLVTKYWVNKISTQFGSSFTAASPRNYNHLSTTPNIDLKTSMYTDLSINMSHIFFIGNNYSVLYFSLSNVLGNDNIIGYRPASLANNDGNYPLVSIKRNMKRFLFIGLFLNF